MLPYPPGGFSDTPLAREFLKTARPLPPLWLDQEDWRKATPNPLAKEEAHEPASSV